MKSIRGDHAEAQAALKAGENPAEIARRIEAVQDRILNLIYDLHDNPHIETTCPHIAAEVAANPDGCDITHRLRAAYESLRWARAWSGEDYRKDKAATATIRSPKRRPAAGLAPAADRPKQANEGENEMPPPPRWRNHPPDQPLPTAELHPAKNGQRAVELEDGRFAATIDHPPQYWFSHDRARRIANYYENRGQLPARIQALPPPPAPPPGENP